MEGEACQALTTSDWSQEVTGVHIMRERCSKVPKVQASRGGQKQPFNTWLLLERRQEQ